MDLILKPTQRCNFSCSFCSSTDIAKSNNTKDDLAVGKIKQFLMRFPKTKNIIVNGGDPLVMPPTYYSEVLDFAESQQMDIQLHFTTNLWDYHLHPEKWQPLFHHPRVTVGTSFDLGDGRRITKNSVFTKELFFEIVEKFKKEFKYVPAFIAVITEENQSESLELVKIAKSMGVECKLSYALKSGKSGTIFPIGSIYNIYLDIYEAGLMEFEFHTKQMLQRLKNDENTICPQNRRCDEGIRNLQPDSASGYNYGSCGAFGDDQQYGIDFEKEMAGEFFKPLQSAFEIQYQKEECLSCPNFNICNGCYKTVSDLKSTNRVEESCREMKRFRQRAIALGLT
jgi:sulfatase maturation enzyme AslB (radical SAM superfamily)